MTPHRAAQVDRRGVLARLSRLVAIPSISGEPASHGAMESCARELARLVRDCGLSRVELVRCGGPPVVFGRSAYLPGRQRLLFYGHYDVQPASGPGWTGDPFRPRVRDGRLYGRGVSDNKGPIIAHLTALRQLTQRRGGLPLNLTIVLEGEEEVGSPHLPRFLRARADQLGADVAVVSDTRMLDAHRPALVYALRGAVSLKLTVTGPVRELHAGEYGGTVRNPAQVLADLISSLHDEHGRVAVPGFGDSVRRPDERERARMAAAGPTDAQLRAGAGTALWGPAGYTGYERTTLLPAVVVTGISAGGAPALGAIPSTAVARISVRLVPDQSPARAIAALRRHLAHAAGPAVRCDVRVLSATPPIRTVTSGPYVRAAERAYRAGFGRSPRFVRSGGTIPAVAALQEGLRVPVLLMGFTPPESRMHGPDENLELAVLWRAIDTCSALLAELARYPDPRVGDVLPGRIPGSTVQLPARDGLSGR